MILPRMKNKALEKHISFYTFLRIRASNLRRFVKTSCTVVKTAFYMYEGTIPENFDVGDKILLFLSLLVFNQNMFGVFAEKFRHGGQKTAFHVKRWSYQEWTNLSNNAEILNFFGNSSVEFTEFDGEASCTVLKTAFYVYEGTIREKSLFLSLLIFSQKTSYFLRKSFSTVVKSAFHVNGWSFRERRINLSNKT